MSSSCEINKGSWKERIKKEAESNRTRATAKKCGTNKEEMHVMRILLEINVHSELKKERHYVMVFYTLQIKLVAHRSLRVCLFVSVCARDTLIAISHKFCAPNIGHVAS